MADEDIVYNELLLLHECSVPDGIDAAAAGQQGGSVCDVIRIAALKAAGASQNLSHPGVQLVLSPDHQWAAVISSQRLVVLYEASDSFKAASSTFEVPLVQNQHGQLLEDPICSCRWSSNSQLLLVSCASATLFVLDRAAPAAPCMTWSSSSAWTQQQLVDAAWGPPGLLLLLTEARVLLLLAVDLAAKQVAAEPVGKFTLKGCHAQVSGLTYAPTTELVLVAGPGAATAPTTSSAGSGSGQPPMHRSSHTSGGTTGGGKEPGLVLSAWKVDPQHQLHLAWVAGRKGGPPLLQRAVVRLAGAEAAAAPQLASWQLAVSPLGEYVAVVTHGGSCFMASLTQGGALVDPRLEFAGRAAAGRPGGLVGPAPVELEEGVSSVAWWGPRHLAVAAADGRVALAALPGALDVLGGEAPGYAPGSRVACIPASATTSHTGLLVLEPLAPAAAHTSSSSRDSLLAGAASPPPAAASGDSEPADAPGTPVNARSKQRPRRVHIDRSAAHMGAVAHWLADRLGVVEEVGAEAAAAAAALAPCGWRLHLLAQRTPQQMVQVYCSAGNWGAAFQLSRRHALDLDVVYRARWAAGAVSKEAILDNLAKMSDRRWVVSECATRVAQDYESQLLLLRYGLRETSRHTCLPGGGAPPEAAAAGSPGPKSPLPGRAGADSNLNSNAGGADGAPQGQQDSPAARWYRWQRLGLLAAYDRLETLQVLTGRCYNAAAYAAFRSEPLTIAAARLAASGAVAAVHVLLQRHAGALQPQLLALLGALPETMDPRAYAVLLPRAGQPPVLQPPVLARKVDWVECAAVAQELAAAVSVGAGAAAGAGTPTSSSTARAMAAMAAAAATSASSSLLRVDSWEVGQKDAVEAAELLRSTEVLVRLAGGLPGPSEEQVLGWYYQRALQLDELTGQLPLAAALLDLAAQRGLTSIPPPPGAPGAPPPLPPAVLGGRMRLHQLLLQTRVLLLTVHTWWPEQLNGSSSSKGLLSAVAAREGKGPEGGAVSPGGLKAGDATSASSSSPEVSRSGSPAPDGTRAPSISSRLSSNSGGPRLALSSSPGDAGVAVWCLTLRQFIALPPREQVEVVLRGRGLRSLDEDVARRLLPLVSCYSPVQQGLVLQQLLVDRVTAGQPGVPGAGSSSGSASMSGGVAGGRNSPAATNQTQVPASSSIAGFNWVVALVQRETAAAARRGQVAPPGSPPPLQPLWRDPAAMALAVMAAVKSCQSTNQWAKLDQMMDAATAVLTAAQHPPGAPPTRPQHPAAPAGPKPNSRGGEDGWEEWSDEEEQPENRQSTSSGTGVDQGSTQQQQAAALAVPPPPAWWLKQRDACVAVAQQVVAVKGLVKAARLLTKCGYPVTVVALQQRSSEELQEVLATLLGRALRTGTSWPDAQWAQLWGDLLEARAAGLPALPLSDLATAFFRSLLRAGRYHLAVAFLPPLVIPGGGGEGEGLGEGEHSLMSSLQRQQQLQQQSESPRAQSGGGGGLFGRLKPPADGGHFGVRAALHTAAGAAVAGTAQLVGASAGLVGKSAQLVQDTTAHLVKPGSNLMAGATVNLVKGTAQLVETAAGLAAHTAAAAAAAAAAGAGGVKLASAAGACSYSQAEAVVVEVSQELTNSCSSLDDPCLQEARRCLELLLPYNSAAALAELSLLEVLLRLPEFGVVLLPAELRGLPDKSVVLKRVLTHRVVPSPGDGAGDTRGGRHQRGRRGRQVLPWQRLGDVLALAEALGMRSEAEQHEVRRLAGELALSAGALDVAQHLALQLAAVRYSPAWQLAAAVAAPHLYPPQPLPADQVDPGVDQRLPGQEEALGDSAQQQQRRGSTASGAAAGAGAAAAGERDEEGEEGWEDAHDDLFEDGEDEGDDGEQHSAASQTSQMASAPALTTAQRVSLLAFAARHCPVQDLPALTDELTSWRALDLARQDASLGVKNVLDGASSALLPKQRSNALKGPGSHVLESLPSLGDAPMAVATLLTGCTAQGAHEAVQQVLGELQQAAADQGVDLAYSQQQRLLMLGTAVQLLHALKLHAAAAVAALTPRAQQQQQEQEQGEVPMHLHRQQLLGLPVQQLTQLAQQLQPSLSQPEANAVAAAAVCVHQLKQVTDRRQVSNMLPHLVNSEGFAAGDEAYRNRVCCELAAQAGQTAVAALLDQGQPGGVDQSKAGMEALAEAEKLASSYGVDTWQLGLWFVHGVIAAAPPGSLSAGSSLDSLVKKQWAELLTRPGQVARHLYHQTYPLLPADATGHISYVLGLLLQLLQSAVNAADANSSSTAEASTAEGSTADSAAGFAGVAVLQPVLQPLEQLVKLLESSSNSRALAGCTFKPVVAVLVKVLVGPCLVDPQQEQQQQGEEEEQVGGKGQQQQQGDAVVGSGGAGTLPPTPPATTSSSSSSTQLPALDYPTLVLEAVSSIWAAVSATPAAAPPLAKFLKHLQGCADLLQAVDRPRYAATVKVLREVPPGLPALVLVSRQLGEGLTANGVAAAAGAGDAQRVRGLYLKTVQPHLSRMSPVQQAAVAGWAVLGRTQPLPEEAVGQLVAVPLPLDTQLQLLADMVNGLVNPKSNSQCSAAVGEDGWPQWVPPAVPKDLPCKRRQLLQPLLVGASQRAMNLLVNWAAVAGKLSADVFDRVLHGAVAEAAEAGRRASDAGASGDASSSTTPTTSSSSSSSSVLHQLLCVLWSGGLLPLGQLLVLAQQYLRYIQCSTAATASSSSAEAVTGGAAGMARADSSGSTTSGDAAAAAAGGSEHGDAAAAVEAGGGGSDENSPGAPAAAAAVAAQAAVTAALQEVLGGVLEYLLQLVKGQPPESNRSTMDRLLLLVKLLDPESSSAPAAAAAAAEALAVAALPQLREQLWQQLADALAGVDPVNYGQPVASALLQLQSDLAAPAGRYWVGWAPACADSAGGAAAVAEGRGRALLLAHTLAALGPELSGCIQASPDDVADVASAANWFCTSLLPAASRMEQLGRLQEVLEGVWGDGAVLSGGRAQRSGDAGALPGSGGPSDAAGSATSDSKGEGVTGVTQEQQQSGEQESGSTTEQEQSSSNVEAEMRDVGSPGQHVSPLHAAWSALLTKMVQTPGGAARVLTVFDRHLSVPSKAVGGPAESTAAAETAAAAAGGGGGGAPCVPLTEDEATQLLVVAGTTCTPSTAAALGLLSPYAAHQEAAASQMLTGSTAGSGTGALQLTLEDPGTIPLLCLLLVRGYSQQLLQLPGATAVVSAAAAESSQASAAAAGNGAKGMLQGLYRLLQLVPPHPSVLPGLAEQQAYWQRRTTGDHPEHPPAAAAAASAAGSAEEPSGQEQQRQQQELAALLLPAIAAELTRHGRYSEAVQLVVSRSRVPPLLSGLDTGLLLLDRFLTAAAVGTPPVAPTALQAAGSSSSSSRRRRRGDVAGGLPQCHGLLAERVVEVCRVAQQHLRAAQREPVGASSGTSLPTTTTTTTSSSRASGVADVAPPRAAPTSSSSSSGGGVSKGGAADRAQKQQQQRKLVVRRTSSDDGAAAAAVVAAGAVPAVLAAAGRDRVGGAGIADREPGTCGDAGDHSPGAGVAQALQNTPRTAPNQQQQREQREQQQAGRQAGAAAGSSDTSHDPGSDEPGAAAGVTVAGAGAGPSIAASSSTPDGVGGDGCINAGGASASGGSSSQEDVPEASSSSALAAGAEVIKPRKMLVLGARNKGSGRQGPGGGLPRRPNPGSRA